MRKVAVFLKYWLPVMIWMALIFSGSTGSLSSQHTSRIIGPVLRWLKPDISPETVYRVVFTVRKTAHVTEYAILALLIWRAWRKPVAKELRPWRWSEAGLAWSVAALYAATDEFHQSFVPSRGASVGDVMLDSAGALAGLLALWVFGRWRKYW